MLLVYKVKDYQELLETNNITAEELIDYMECSNEDESLIDIVKRNEKLSFEENEIIISVICQMLRKEHNIIDITFEKNVFEYIISEDRKYER